MSADEATIDESSSRTSEHKAAVTSQVLLWAHSAKTASQLKEHSLKETLKATETAETVTEIGNAALAVTTMGTLALSQLTNVTSTNAITSALQNIGTASSGASSATLSIAGPAMSAFSGISLIAFLGKMAIAYRESKKKKDPKLIKKFWEGESGAKQMVPAIIGVTAGALMVAFSASAPIAIALAGCSLAAKNLTDVIFNAVKLAQIDKKIKANKEKIKGLSDTTIPPKERVLAHVEKETLIKQLIEADILTEDSANSINTLSKEDILDHVSKKNDPDKENTSPQAIESIFLKAIKSESDTAIKNESAFKLKHKILKKKLIISAGVMVASATAFTLLGIGVISANPVLIGIGAAVMGVVALFGLAMMIKGLIKKHKKKKSANVTKESASPEAKEAAEEQVKKQGTPEPEAIDLRRQSDSVPQGGMDVKNPYCVSERFAEEARKKTTSRKGRYSTNINELPRDVQNKQLSQYFQTNNTNNPKLPKAIKREDQNANAATRSMLSRSTRALRDSTKRHSNKSNDKQTTTSSNAQRTRSRKNQTVSKKISSQYSSTQAKAPSSPEWRIVGSAAAKTNVGKQLKATITPKQEGSSYGPQA